jgi:hypothetical protein
MHVTTGVGSGWTVDRSKKIYHHTMEIEQMLARLLAERKTNQEHLKEEIRVGQEHLKEEMRAGQKLLTEKMMAKLHAHHERMMARMDSHLDKIKATVDVFEESLNKMDITDLETNKEKLEATAEQQVALKEEAMVKIIGALVDQYGDQQLALWRHQQPKKQTQGSGRSQKKLATI